VNKANLKSYAPKARVDFIKAVTERANVLGISAAGAAPAQSRGDVAIIDGREWPAKVAGQRDELIARIKRHGFEQTMDEVAYTWFNRFAALRYMEIHDYLDHGWRVLSSRDGGLPEILRHASEVTLPGLNADRAREMQLAGNQDNELYKLLLVAQCNELSRVMPFLFERIDDETELLLPENLLRTDSIVAKLVESVPEEDWQEIEVIGWLYQFYISEKKDQVIGKVVKSEDIPAATQLFTPNWIVQYLVQNSVGRLWLMANPNSTLASQWPYYIQPAEQTPEVQAQLDALIQARIREDGERLNPETITVLDPACGSGHILVVAYDVLKAIYLENGYQLRSIPRLILEKNLFGLDIDDRAGQLAAFALLMKARADDRRLFNDPPKLNVLSLQESGGLDVNELATHLGPFGLQRSALKALVDAFESAKSFGSLVKIPEALNGQLPLMTTGLQQSLREGDLYAQQASKDVLPLVWQALVLGMRFDAVVANPPYLGSKGMNSDLKEFAAGNYHDYKADTFAMFSKRCLDASRSTGSVGLMTPFVWMFIKTYENLRKLFVESKSIHSLVHPEYHAFFESAYVPICAFVVNNFKTDQPGQYFDLRSFPSADQQATKLLEAIGARDCSWRYSVLTDEFTTIPGDPIVYWLPRVLRASFKSTTSIANLAEPRIGMATCDNRTFLRLWSEVSFKKIGFGSRSRADALASRRKWFPHHKGGEFRRWYGNIEYVVNWEFDGQLLQTTKHPLEDRIRAHNFNLDYIFKPALVWTSVTSSIPSFRLSDYGYLFDAASGLCPVRRADDTNFVLGLLNSKITLQLQPALNPTLNLVPGDLARIPVNRVKNSVLLDENVSRLIEIFRCDWDQFESSWEFKCHPFVVESINAGSLERSFQGWADACNSRIGDCKRLEEENNGLFIEAYGLQDELSTEVPEDQISLGRADREKDCQRLVSYGVGCMMGRYSLDEPGLVYAHAGNVSFDPSRYEKKFPADADGIVPLTGERWFEDDAASRVREFLRAVWGAETLEENVTWLAESLGTKGGETPDETIRRYLADKFFKDHLQAYKKRPIYWLFSSGKQGAFQALVYLHRYNEGTLARMRANYVVPLIAKVVSRLDMLDKDVAAATSAAARTKLQKQIESLRKKQIELLAYDEKLRHYADIRITLDLDDGVKVNYAKFGDLVAEAKTIAGGSDE
jgi:hypothetical protein